VILHNGKFEKTQGYCTDVFFRRALDWMDGRRKSGQPFFAYIATNAPHAPLHVREEDKALYQNAGLPDSSAAFFGMIHNIDQNVGRTLSALKDWDIERETLVVFMNDNGGTEGTAVFNAGMKGRKGSAWLGGTRASSFWRWPQTITPGESRALCAHLDVFPTLAEIAGAKLAGPVQKQVEGRSLVPMLENPAVQPPDRVLFTHVGRWGYQKDPESLKYTQCSVRNTRWHLVSIKGGTKADWQLFDVSSDFGEETNVAGSHPEIVTELAAKYEEFWREATPLMVNEKVTGPRINPFSEKYHRQFGSSPSAADLKRMAPPNVAKD
jgi:arylsulfatase